MIRSLLPCALLAVACGDDGGALGQADVSHLELPSPADPPASDFDAADHTSPTSYPALLVEIDYVTARAPRDVSLTQVQGALDRMIAAGDLGKPGGIELRVDDVLSAAPNGHVYTTDELNTIARAFRDEALADDTASIHVLYVDGAWEGDDGAGTVLGIAYGGSWMVVFADSLNAACERSTRLPLLGTLREEVCARTEASVFLHELGHLFGLVNSGTSMVTPHEDAEHPGHDADADCLMYWAIERASAVDVIADRFSDGGQPELGFCAASLADLRAAAQR